MTDIRVINVTSAEDLAEVVTLCWAYRDFLLHNSDVDRDITETFYPTAHYETIMADLAHLHERPQGIILLARDSTGTAVGCGMTHALEPDTAEIKRVFVTEAARGKGVAEQICQALIGQAKTDGFQRVVLDTSKSLHAAQRLYLRLGFVPCGPYQPIPAEILSELVFFEKDLRSTAR